MEAERGDRAEEQPVSSSTSAGLANEARNPPNGWRVGSDRPVDRPRGSPEHLIYTIAFDFTYQCLSPLA